MKFSHKTILIEELRRQKKTNPVYSLRAFARDLQITAPQLSSVMNGHKGISPITAKKLAARLVLTNEEVQIFLDSAMARDILHTNSKSKMNMIALGILRKATAQFAPELEWLMSITTKLRRMFSDWERFSL